MEELDVVDEARLIPSDYGGAGDRLASVDGIPLKVSLRTVNRLRSEHELSYIVLVAAKNAPISAGPTTALLRAEV